MRYAADISKVAARQPGGRDKIRSTVEAKVPQAVGKLVGIDEGIDRRHRWIVARE